MNVLIVEDEPQAAQRLERLLTSIRPEAVVVGKIDSVMQTVEWFRSNPSPHLVLMDIHLADGLSFQIFEMVEIKAPVIFTTAYDEYALKAFKVNSIDYILKPVDEAELERALNKLSSLSRQEGDSKTILSAINQAMHELTKKYKTRFVTKVGEHLRTIEVDSILYFVSQDKATFCCTNENRKLIIDFTLEQLEEVLDPQKFFRINRKYYVNSAAINDIITYTNSRLKLILKGTDDNDIIVARERVQEFKDWLDR